MLHQSRFRSQAESILERYGILLSGIVIFLFYLWVAIDLIANPNARRDFSGYFLQFSSVVMLWGLVCLGAKLFDYKKRQKEEEERNRTIVREYERGKMQLELLDEVSTLLNDTVNNPLSVISLSASSIRERFSPDSEILTYLDSIDAALRRAQEVLTSVRSYKTTKIVKSIQDAPSRLLSTQ